MDRCSYCKEYHQEFEICDGYIKKLSESGHHNYICKNCGTTFLGDLELIEHEKQCKHVDKNGEK